MADNRWHYSIPRARLSRFLLLSSPPIRWKSRYSLARGLQSPSESVSHAARLLTRAACNWQARRPSGRRAPQLASSLGLAGSQSDGPRAHTRDTALGTSTGGAARRGDTNPFESAGLHAQSINLPLETRGRAGAALAWPTCCLFPLCRLCPCLASHS